MGRAPFRAAGGVVAVMAPTLGAELGRSVWPGCATTVSPAGQRTR
ncbi:hypothetical protein UO65_0652 [Actinokineospora spheciospongiae]|uniref:Uncharacterized protein n=1 Tax=Actinokineospora spheciospongiae TaxID=909613 RepID=W7J4U4_9PSEU|nr:hypothetical protein UO65_0652 [Actinokineospora spheciospongiae]